jgi:hypothetical protein
LIPSMRTTRSTQWRASSADRPAGRQATSIVPAPAGCPQVGASLLRHPRLAQTFDSPVR